MKIRSEDGSSTLGLEPVSFEGSTYYASVSLSVDIISTRLEAHFQEIWFGATGLETFARALRVLDEERRAPARLEAMSPGHFLLTIYPTGSGGHIALTVEVVSSVFVGDKVAPHSATHSFVIDPTSLSGVAREVDLLLQSIESHAAAQPRLQPTDPSARPA